MKLNTSSSCYNHSPDEIDDTQAQEAISLEEELSRTKAELEQYRTLYQNTPCLYFTLDLTGKFISVNEFGSKCLGYDIDELINKSIFSILHPEDRERLQAEFTAFIQPNLSEIINLEFRTLCKNDIFLRVTAISRAVQQADGNILIILMANVINECKEVEERLRKLSSAVEQTADNVIITNKEGVIEYVNPAFEQLTGYTKAEVIGQTPKILYSGQHDKKFYQELWQTINSGKVFRAVFVNSKKGGELFYEEKTITPIRERNGKITHFVSTGKDITERKQVEEKIIRICKAVESASDAIGMAAATGTSIYHNKAFLNLFEYTVEELNAAGGPPALYANPDVAREVFETIGSGNCWSGELEMRSRSGKKLQISLRAHAIKDDNDKLVGLIGFHTDISDAVAAAEQRKQAEAEKQMLISIVENSSDFIAISSLEGQVIFVNEAGRKLVGLGSLEEALSKSISDYFSETGWKQFCEITIPAIWTIGRSEGESQLRHFKTGKLIDVYRNCFVINHPQTGEPICVATVQRDITSRKQAEEALRVKTERERLMAAIAQRIRQSLNLKEILNTTVAEVRQFLQTDRVLIYRLQPDWSGIVVVESVGGDWMPILGKVLIDPQFAEQYIPLYTTRRIQATHDIYTAGLPQCHIDLLDQFQVRASLIVPILQEEQLWGLLIAHQCSGSREWQQLEIDLVEELATQLAIAIQQAELYQRLEVANQALQHLASLDGLTQLANRRRFDEYLDKKWRRLANEQAPLSAILCDIDCFKAYNDTYGHLAGDDCLRQVARAIRLVVKRPADLVARYGGEEFAVILPNMNGFGAMQVAEEIRVAVRALEILHERSLVSQYVTLSLGVASTVPSDDANPAILIAAADRALYRAKAEGRDRSALSRESRKVR